jgi:NAD(P)-dependent dehydrogenase (short-subunit alcohol dehydrogenase family)
MKNIVITGASSGIGFELALKFASKEYQVLAISRKIPDAFLKQSNISCLSIDITNTNELELIKQFVLKKGWTKIDAIIHNAGHLILKPFEETTLEDFENTYKVNVFGVASITKICLPFLQNGSHVVSISSMGGIQGSQKFAGLSAYSSSKGALITLSELLAVEYKDRGIAFNVLALGAVQTEMLAKAFPDYKAPISAGDMANYIFDFTTTGNRYFNGKIIEVATSNP